MPLDPLPYMTVISACGWQHAIDILEKFLRSQLELQVARQKAMEKRLKCVFKKQVEGVEIFSHRQGFFGRCFLRFQVLKINGPFR